MVWLSAGIVGGILIATALIYDQARDEANALFDYQMQQLAAALPSQWAAPPAFGIGAFRPDEDVVIHIWDGNGRSLYLSHVQPALPQRAELGFANVATADGQWRVYSVQLGASIIQIAQPLRARRAVAARMAVRVVAPLIILLPLLGWLVWIAVGRGLRPVRDIASQVRARDAAALGPLQARNLPDEIVPLTESINALLARLESAMTTQRAFIADAAHALRTPLTAFRLQLEVLERAPDDAVRQVALQQLRAGALRLTHLLTQLLTLARHEPGAAGVPHERVALPELVRDVAAELGNVAVARGIDLSVTVTGDAIVNGDRDALRLMLSNLIDNAVRYTPSGGRVDVSVDVDGEKTTLVVEDSGPGIPEALRHRVFDRFYRLPDAPGGGSGLGLAIVDEIARSHGATVSLDTGRDGTGLRVSVAFRS